LGGSPDAPQLFEAVRAEDLLDDACHVKPAYGHDKARAQQMLDAVGWKVNAAAGIREKDGVPFRFEMLTNAGNKARESMQQQWREIGIDASPKLLPLPQFGGLLSGARTFDLFLIGFTYNTLHAPT
jgi:peptide/nickel transport system substrate-binding protein